MFFCIEFLLMSSCRPPTLLIDSGLVHDDLSGWEVISHAILRYQHEDILQYMFDSYAYLNDYPREIHSPYINYIPKERSGVLGVHVGRSFVSPLAAFEGKIILPLSEMRNYRDMENFDVYYLPLYRYQIHDSVIDFRRMTQEERIADTTQIARSIYTKAYWLHSRSYRQPITTIPHFNEVEVEPDVRMIFHQRYEVKYKYLIGRDTLSWYNKGFYCKNHLVNIPMFYLPLDTNVYYKKNMRKYLVKKRLGFCPLFDEPEYNHLADYRHEIDTALLALPIRIFQEKYLQTKELYCLDGVSVHINRDEE
jgi:hypothetical protein